MDNLLSTSALAMLLSLAAIFLGLAAAVQIVQEFYKHLSRSEARAYRMVLLDFAGPWIEQIFQPGVISDLQVRGPFQFLKIRPQGLLLPMGKDELLQAVERVAPVWVRRVLEQLQAEKDLHKSAQKAIWSPAWQKLKEELNDLDQEDPTSWDAERVRTFLDETPFKDAETLLIAFRQRFLSDATRLERFFPQFQRNLEYSYQRRNLRQTFTFAFLLSLLFYLPFSELLAQASQQTLSQAVEFAGGRLEATHPSASTPPQNVQEMRNQVEPLVRPPGDKTGTPLLDRTSAKYLALGKLGPLAIIGFLFNCLLTAFLVSFGAPLWHNLTSALWRVGRDRLGLPAGEEK
jgi:hypothetical protein